MDFESTLEEKLEELAQKHEIPVQLIRDAIDMEKEKVVLQNRRLGPKIAELVGEYASGNVSDEGGQ